MYSEASGVGSQYLGRAFEDTIKYLDRALVFAIPSFLVCRPDLERRFTFPHFKFKTSTIFEFIKFEFLRLMYVCVQCMRVYVCLFTYVWVYKCVHAGM